MHSPFSPGIARHQVAFGMLLVSFCFSSRLCHAEPVAREAQARRSYDHALALFDEGQNRAALAELERAYQLVPSFRIFYNIAIVNVTLDDPAAALSAFDRYLSDGGAQIEPNRREEVGRRMAALSVRACSLRVKVDVVGAVVLIDETQVGTSPLPTPLWLDPGEHRIEVRASNGRSQAKALNLVAGSNEEESFELQPAESVAQRARTPRASDPAPAFHLPWAAYSVTAALGVGTVITGALALGARGDERDVERRLTTPQELSDARQKVEHLALASDLFLAATAVGAGVSIYLTLDAKSDRTSRAALVLEPSRISALARF